MNSTAQLFFGTFLVGVLPMTAMLSPSDSFASNRTHSSSSQAHCGGGAPRCETLEVLSLGVTYDRYRQGMLWEALKSGTAFSPLREANTAITPWSSDDKILQSGKRAVDAFENAIAATPMYWGMPSMYAGIPLREELLREIVGPIIGLTGSAEQNGFSWHLFVASDWLLAEGPDQIFELAFQFFDKHADVPLLFISVVDDPYTHDMNSLPGAPRLLRNGRYFLELPDSTVVFALGRRERVEPLREFAWDDRDNDFGQTKIRAAYYDLRTRLSNGRGHNLRHLATDEWIAEAARLAAREDIRSGWGAAGLRKRWKPTPWFPVPWSTNQLSAFDSLPTLGFVHRPVFVEWKDQGGKAVQDADQRAALLRDGFEKAIRGAGSSSDLRYPARIVTANGGRIDRALILHNVLNITRANGGPVYETTDKAKFIDTDRRLGNTGAATFFMQAAIGVMGSYREGGVSAAINMRDPNGASIMLISPPSDELRAKQQHPSGGDVFRHKVEPAFDPDVYK